MYVGFDTCVLYNIVVFVYVKSYWIASSPIETNLQFIKDDILYYLLSSSIYGILMLMVYGWRAYTSQYPPSQIDHMLITNHWYDYRTHVCDNHYFCVVLLDCVLVRVRPNQKVLVSRLFIMVMAFKSSSTCLCYIRAKSIG